MKKREFGWNVILYNIKRKIKRFPKPSLFPQQVDGVFRSVSRRKSLIAKSDDAVELWSIKPNLAINVPSNGNNQTFIFWLIRSYVFSDRAQTSISLYIAHPIIYQIKMKTIQFYCNHCETRRAITIKKADPFYIIGNCSICKSKVIINSRKLKNPPILKN
ncbi:MAG: hypothetical protein Q7S74_01555 [Nanoarchaeota archaeon]|nr:hypothetical protein [Nanoarchaeota archaeon]